MRLMIRLGILGAGTMARTHIAACRGLSGVRIAGVSAARPESLVKLEQSFGVPAVGDVDALLRNVDAVDVCLPTPLHEEAVLHAAAAGVHVLCEKPIALDAASAERMTAACRRAGVVFMVAHCLRFQPEYLFLKRALDAGRGGRLISLELERFAGAPRLASRGWMLDARRSGGAALDLHIHDADMALFLLGRPRAVRAREIIDGSFMRIDAEYFYRGAAPAVRARGGWMPQENYPFYMAYRAVFEDATVEYDTRRSPALTVFRSGRKPRHPRIPQGNCYREEIRYFLQCVRMGTSPETATGEHARDSLALVLAERRSARLDRRVSF